ncbi:MAG: metallophosphoesterase family protein [bacterium]
MIDKTMHIIEGTPRRIGVFSDIHGNLHALESVLEQMTSLGADVMICCGDVVGYGGNPNECVNILRERQISTIAGNHDFAALDLTDSGTFNPAARRAIIWTQEALTPENARWLRERPLDIEAFGMLFVHASPLNPHEWSYIITMGDARESFRHFTHRFCFIGHSHMPFVVENENGRLNGPCTPVIQIKKSCRYIVNVGSVGQPRDRNPDSCFTILDLDAGSLQFHRVKYDLDGAQKEIRLQGLPPELADRLAHGR